MPTVTWQQSFFGSSLLHSIHSERCAATKKNTRVRVQCWSNTEPVEDDQLGGWFSSMIHGVKSKKRDFIHETT